MRSPNKIDWFKLISAYIIIMTVSIILGGYSVSVAVKNWNNTQKYKYDNCLENIKNKTFCQEQMFKETGIAFK